MNASVATFTPQYFNRSLKREAKRASVVAHNERFEEIKSRRMPLVIPQPPAEPELIQPKQGYTKPVNISGVLALGFALMAKTMSVPNRYRGYLPSYLGKRSQARAAGYSNQREMIALQNAERLRQQAEADAGKAENEAAHLEAARELLVKDGILLADKPTLEAAA